MDTYKATRLLQDIFENTAEQQHMSSLVDKTWQVATLLYAYEDNAAMQLSVNQHEVYLRKTHSFIESMFYANVEKLISKA